MARHSSLYRVGRALYEVADYFGQIMGRKQKVYHGLNRKMFFKGFTEYFYAPTSTTESTAVGMPQSVIFFYY